MALFDKAVGAVQRGFDFMVNSFNKYKGVADAAAKAGMNTDDFQEFAFAADQSGVAMGSVSKAIKEMRKNIRLAMDDGSEMNRRFKALGFTQEQLAKGNLKAKDVFLQLASAMELVGSDAEQLAILTKFMKEGTAQGILPMMQSRADLQKSFGSAFKVDEESMKNIKLLGDLFSKIYMILEAIGATTFIGMLTGRGRAGPAMTAALTAILAMIPNVSLGQAFSQVTALQAGLRGLAEGGDNAGTAGPKPDVAALTSMGAATEAANAGGGTIGVGASAQFALMQESNQSLKDIDSKLGLLVNAGIPVDFTKPQNRKYPMWSDSLSR